MGGQKNFIPLVILKKNMVDKKMPMLGNDLLSSKVTMCCKKQYKMTVDVRSVHYVRHFGVVRNGKSVLSIGIFFSFAALRSIGLKCSK